MELCKFCSGKLTLTKDDFLRKEYGRDVWQKVFECEYGHISKFAYIPDYEYDTPIQLDILDAEGRKIYA